MAKIIDVNRMVQCAEDSLYLFVCNDAGLYDLRKAWKRGKVVQNREVGRVVTAMADLRQFE